MSAPLPLFVYGTLMTGQSSAGLLGALPRRPAVVYGRLYHLPAGYPAVSLGGDDPVHGELIFAPTPAVIAVLDHYEGVGEGLYDRVVTRAYNGLAQQPTQIYVMAHPERHGGRRLIHGRWRSPRGSSSWTAR